MNYDQSDPNTVYLPEPVQHDPGPEAPNGMSRAAFVCGILSLLGLFFNGAVFFGAFAILFALLSRKKQLSRQAKAAVRMAVVGIAVSAVIIIVSLGVLISSGVLKKYAKRIAEVNPDDPAAVSELQNDLLSDLAKSYGIDPSSLRQSQEDEDSPFDPTIANDNSNESEAASGTESSRENDTASGGSSAFADNDSSDEKNSSGSDPSTASSARSRTASAPERVTI